MKLSQYAKKNNLTYRTAFRHWQLGLLKGRQLATGTIVIEDDTPEKNNDRVILYARVSSSENKTNLESQLNRLRDYANAKGYIIFKEIKEIGSGLNDNRPQLAKILERPDWSKIIVEHKDRLARFGINYIQLLLRRQGQLIEVINETQNDTQDLMQDFVSIITSFTARLYGLRRSKRQTEQIIKTLHDQVN